MPYVRRYTPRRKTGRRYFRGRGAYTVARYRAGRQYVRGRGAYRIPRNFFNAEKVGRAAGSAIGAVIGNTVAPGSGLALGSDIGGSLGAIGGKLFRRITGWGNYAIKENSLLHNGKIATGFAEDAIRVAKREFICELNASTGFVNNSFPIQPGASETFPWLAQIAQNYEQYRFHGLLFEYISTSSDAIASSTDLGMGQVVMATDYNAADHPYINGPQMMGSMFSKTFKPSENCIHPVECAPSDQAQKLYYVRTGVQPTGTDIRLYDMGIFQIATQNMPAAYSGMGQLWVTYDVEFTKSVMNSQLGFDLNTDHWELEGISNANYLGTSQTMKEHSNLGTVIESNTLYFPPALSSGYYLVIYDLSDNDSPGSFNGGTWTRTNCTFVSSIFANAADQISNTGETTNRGIKIEIIKITARDASIAFSSLTSPGFPLRGDLIITQVNGEIYADA